MLCVHLFLSDGVRLFRVSHHCKPPLAASGSSRLNIPFFQEDKATHCVWLKETPGSQFPAKTSCHFTSREKVAEIYSCRREPRSKSCCHAAVTLDLGPAPFVQERKSSLTVGPATAAAHTGAIHLSGGGLSSP